VQTKYSFKILTLTSTVPDTQNNTKYAKRKENKRWDSNKLHTNRHKLLLSSLPLDLQVQHPESEHFKSPLVVECLWDRPIYSNPLDPWRARSGRGVGAGANSSHSRSCSTSRGLEAARRSAPLKLRAGSISDGASICTDQMSQTGSQAQKRREYPVDFQNKRPMKTPDRVSHHCINMMWQAWVKWKGKRFQSLPQWCCMLLCRLRVVLNTATQFPTDVFWVFSRMLTKWMSIFRLEMRSALST